MRSKLFEIWKRLGKKERHYISAGAALLVAFIVIQSAVLPFFDARGKMQRSLKSNEKVLKEMVVLGSEYQALRKNVEQIQAGLSRRAPDFSLFSYLEKKAGESRIKSNIKQMHPSRSPVSGNIEETSVEIKLEKITLNQLVHFLHAAESPEQVVRVRRISIRKSVENPAYLSAVVQLVTYQQATEANAPAPREGIVR